LRSVAYFKDRTQKQFLIKLLKFFRKIGYSVFLGCQNPRKEKKRRRKNITTIKIKKRKLKTLRKVAAVKL